MKLYKLTDQQGKTQNNTQWGENVTHTADGNSKELCNEHWLHAYPDPLLAVLMNPVHADINNPKLWECIGKVGLAKPDKIGCTELTTIKEIPLPEVTTAQKVKFACLCARKVYKYWKKYDKGGVWLKWYNAGCPQGAAGDTAWAAAGAAARAAAGAAAGAAAWAAAGAARAAAGAAGDTAWAAAWAAARAAAGDAANINLVKLAHKAMES